MLKVVVGHSNDPDSRLGIAEVIAQCIQQLGNIRPQAGILLAAIDYDHPLLLEQVSNYFPDIELIGGTTAGEISSRLGYQQDSLMLMLFASEQVEIHAGLGRGIGKDMTIACQQAVTQAKAKCHQPIKFCLTFPEALTVSGDEIIRGLSDALGENVPIFGGLASGVLAEKRQFQFFQTEVLGDAVPILVFAGALEFSHGVASGWVPAGNASLVTKAEGNIVYEIDGKSALDFYQDYLGQQPSDEYPLVIFTDKQQQNFYMRSPNGYDIETGYVSFAGDVPENAIVQISEASCQNILDAVKVSLQQALTTYPDDKKPDVAMFFSCVSRHHLLGSRTCEEYEIIQSYLSCNIPLIGFYTFGEIAPFSQTKSTYYHNETLITLLFGVG